MVDATQKAPRGMKAGTTGMFSYIHNGPATPMDQLTEEQSAAEMATWGAWTREVGAAMLPRRNTTVKCPFVRQGGPFGATG